MTVSSLYLACLWLKNFKKNFFGVLFIISKFPFLTVLPVWWFFVFQDKGLIFKTSPTMFSLVPWQDGSDWRKRALPYLWAQKWAWTSLSLEPLVRVFSHWSSWYVVRVRRRFTILQPPFAEGEIESHRKEGIFPKWNVEPEPRQDLTWFLVCTSLDHCYHWVDYSRD